MSALNRSRLGLAALVLLAVAFAWPMQGIGPNEASHLALVKALADGTARVDTSITKVGEAGAGTPDVRRWRGHLYSNKPPGLATQAGTRPPEPSGSSPYSVARHPARPTALYVNGQTASAYESSRTEMGGTPAVRREFSRLLRGPATHAYPGCPRPSRPAIRAPGRPAPPVRTATVTVTMTQPVAPSRK